MGFLNRASRRAAAHQARVQQLPTHLSSDDLQTMLADKSDFMVAQAAFAKTLTRLGQKYGFDLNVGDVIDDLSGQIVRVDRALMAAVQDAANKASQNGQVVPAETKEATNDAAA